MVDIEECSLRTFKKDLFTALNSTMEIHHGVTSELAQFFSSREIALIDFAKADRLRAERLEDSVVLDHLGL